MSAMKRALTLSTTFCAMLTIFAPGTAAVAADMPAMDHAKGHAVQGAAGTGDSAAVEAYRQANDHMHQAMTASYSGNADVDFARGMIPHHQGAIDMAKVELKYGTDPQMRILAKQIINDQQAEIATLKSWLESHDKSATP